MQLAVYDAVQAIGGRYKPYKLEIPGASGSPDAAAAKAAHDVLVNILPAQTASLDTAYRDYLTKKGLAENDPGVSGQKAAAGIIAARASDGRAPNPPPDPFNGDTAVGKWRPTTTYQSGPPPSGAAMAAPWLGAVPAVGEGAQCFNFFVILGVLFAGQGRRRLGAKLIAALQRETSSGAAIDFIDVLSGCLAEHPMKDFKIQHGVKRGEFRLLFCTADCRLSAVRQSPIP